jgi:hypothetical protein
MPRRKVERGERSAAVRELLAQNPKMPVKQIVSTLAVRGLKVNPNLVYALKTRSRVKHRKQQRQQAVQAGRNAGMANPVALVLRVRQLAVEAGGMKHLKELVDVLVE